MFSQSLVAQLARWLAVLALTLVGVNHCAPLKQALAEYAVDGGCHQHQQMNDEGDQPLSGSHH